MTLQRSADVPLDGEVGASAGGSPISVDERELTAKPVVTSRLIYALMAYYIALIAGSIAVITVLVWQFGEIILAPPKGETPIVIKVLASMAFLVSGAIVGSVLYQIRALFRSYIKLANFDPRWLPKHISAPMEAAGLALVIASLIEGGAIVLGGQGFDFSHGKPFPSFGIGALIGFGIREVVGWLGTVIRVVFPTDTLTSQSVGANQQERNGMKR